MNKISCYNGILYKIEYKPELSQKDYTQRHVYHIKTNDKNYLRAHNAIKSIMKKEEYYMIREYNQYSLCKHLNNGMSISVTTIYAKNSGEAESMARINGIKYDFILETKLIK